MTDARNTLGIRSAKPTDAYCTLSHMHTDARPRSFSLRYSLSGSMTVPLRTLSTLILNHVLNYNLPQRSQSLSLSSSHRNVHMLFSLFLTLTSFTRRGPALSH